MSSVLDIPRIKMWDRSEKKVAKEALNKISIAKLKIQEIAPFYYNLLYLLDIIPIENTMTMGTDGKILGYNPHFILNNVTDNELKGVLLHEILHCSLRHLWRKGKRKMRKWNRACDYAINPIVRDQGLLLPKGALLEQKYYDMSAEEIYSKLKEPPRVKIKIQTSKKNGGKNKEKDSGGGDYFSSSKFWGKKISKKKGKGSGKKSKKSKGKKGMDKITGEIKNKKRNKKLEQKWKDAFKVSCKNTKPGKLPGKLKRYYEEVVPKENWIEILSVFLSASQDDFSFSYPDRRFLDSSFILPSMQDESAIEDIVIAIDTSGSISQQQFNNFVAEAKSIVNAFPSFDGWLVQCDTEIQGEQKMVSGEPFKTHLMGGGGTNFNPVFDWVKEKGLNPKVLVYLTDGYGDFPIDSPDYPVIWLIDSEVEAPWGRKIQYKSE